MLKLQENFKKDPSCKVIKQHLKNHNTFTFRHITLNEIKKVIHDFFLKIWQLVVKYRLITVLLSRLQLCLESLNMLTVEGCYKTGLLRHLSNHVFRSLEFRIYISYDAQFDVDFRNAIKNFEITFSFLDNWNSIGCGKFVLSPREHFLATVDVLKNSPKISNITKREIFQLNFFDIDETIW